MHPNVYSSTIYNSQDVETTQVSMDRGMDKEDVVHMYNGILLSHQKEWIHAICSNMDGPRDYHTKTDRERQISYDITYTGNLKKYNKLANITKKQQTHRHREQTSGFL